jgi:hypothetical protein
MAAATPHHPDTRALARFLVAITVCTIVLLVGLVVTIGVTHDAPSQTPIAATTR